MFSIFSINMVTICLSMWCHISEQLLIYSFGKKEDFQQYIFILLVEGKIQLRRERLKTIDRKEHDHVMEA